VINESAVATDLSFLEHENNPEILREFTKIMAHEIDRLQLLVAQARAEQDKSEQQSLDLNSKYALLRRDYFGRGREKLSNKNADRPRDKASQEVLFHAQSLVPAPEEKDIKLPQEKVRHTATTDELDEMLRSREPELAKDFKAEWKELASFSEDAKEITIIERTYVEVLHVRQKYKTSVTNPVTGEEKEVIIAAPGPERLLPGCTYGITMAVAVVADKYLMHLPLDRQRRAMQALGLNISVKTLWNLCWAVGGHLDPIAKAIRLEILGENLCVHADETPWPILNNKDSDGQMWCLSNMAGSYYKYEPTRSGKIIQEMLEGHKGPVLSDGFSGYNRLRENSNIQQAYCWAHVRRKFFDITESLAAKDPPQDNPAARKIVEMIDELFSYERGIKTAVDLKKSRAEKSAPLVQKIKSLLDEECQHHFRDSDMKKSLVYTLKLWQGLTLFLEDTRIPLSNNDAERTLRHAVVGRKNYYGSKTINGADLAATLFTVIESCKRVQLDPRAFVEMVVRRSAHGENPPTPLAYARMLRSAPSG
jgi:transposase